MHGQFVWYDLMSSDAATSKKFYPAVLGWKTMAFEDAPPDQPYTMWTRAGTPLGGVAQLSDEMRAQGLRSHWIPTVEVRNVDESVRQAQALGAQVHFGPQDIPGTGRYASLADPQGASFAMYTPARETYAFDGKPVVGRFSWHELMTTDYERAFDFYRRLFGWEKTSEYDMGGGNMYLMYGMGGVPFGGIYNRTPEMPAAPPNWLSYVHVKDVRKTTEVAKRAGARLVNGPMEVPGGDWIAAFTDPQGAAFAIHQSAGAGPAAGSAAARRKPARAKSKSAGKKKSRTSAGPGRKRARAAKGSAQRRAGAKRSGAAKGRSGAKRTRARAGGTKRGRRR